ncbi:MAG TPA: pilus assembly protein TadG-related protein [Candidatus Binataceae bacterium]|nr:pilus assembly protein TadG-related protein [Candidatus Binataceae bacterium]
MKGYKDTMVTRMHEVLARRRQANRGQAMVLVALALVGLCAMTGLLIDCGRAYYGYQELVASTQAAALAGASVLNTSTAGQAISTATSYSAVSGNLNSGSNLAQLANVSMATGYPKVRCLNSLGIDCTASPANANALAVSQKAVIPTTFLRVIGINSIPLAATATAAARSGTAVPYNVEIIIDTTSSMNSIDSSASCNGTRISCALAGVQVLLNSLSPCYAGLSSCGSASGSLPSSGNNVSNPVDEVGIMAFPGLASASESSKDYVCPTSNPTTVKYNAGPTYSIVPFSSDFRNSDTATSLNGSSPLVIAAGGGSCSGLKAPGGQGTFYAGVIDAAQAALTANARPNTKNVMILLSDGDATASASQMGGSSSSYPATQECHQAVAAAQRASAAGTIVYSVAYGSPSSGCTTDTSPSITPCQTMQQIASSPQNFFSDYSATGGSGSCVSSSRSASSLNEIFKSIANDLTVSRLIPNNAV